MLPLALPARPNCRPYIVPITLPSLSISVACITQTCCVEPSPRPQRKPPLVRRVLPANSPVQRGLAAMLNQIFGGPQNIGDVEFWHGPERAGWLMKQGMLASLQHVPRES